MIHETAIVSKEAEIGKNVTAGPFAIIDGNTVIGDGCEIGPRAHILDGARIGRNNYIGEGTLIGNAAQDVKFKGGESFVKIGDNNVIREYVTINRANKEGGETVVGDNNFIMIMAHIAHDCRIGSNITIVNWAGITGHVEVGDCAFVSGLSAIHQNVRIGTHSMVGGGIKLTKDVMPYTMVSDNPARLGGLNIVGLKRRGFSGEKIALLKKAYSIFFREKKTVKEAIKEIKGRLEQAEEIKNFIDFAESSKRGIVR